MVKPARKQFNVPLYHSLVQSRTNEVIENFSYMIFIFTLHKHTCSNAIDKFQVHIKQRRRRNGCVRQAVSENYLQKQHVKELILQHTPTNVCTLERKCVISNKYAKSLDYTAKKIRDYFCLISKNKRQFY